MIITISFNNHLNGDAAPLLCEESSMLFQSEVGRRADMNLVGCNTMISILKFYITISTYFYYMTTVLRGNAAIIYSYALVTKSKCLCMYKHNSCVCIDIG